MQRILNQQLLRVLCALAVISTTAIRPAEAKKSKYRTLKSSLKRGTAKWSQSRSKNGYPVGCGPCAWGIVMEYWNRRGYKKLANGSKYSKDLWEIAKDVKTKYGSYKGSKFGRTMPGNMLNIKSYIKRRGYGFALDRVRGTEFGKCKKVRYYIDRDRPVVLLISDPKRPLGSLHYVVIEKVELLQKRVAGKWYDQRVRYYVNWGNGTCKWICVREKGKNTQKRTGSYSIFLLRMN